MRGCHFAISCLLHTTPRRHFAISCLLHHYISPRLCHYFCTLKTMKLVSVFLCLALLVVYVSANTSGDADIASSATHHGVALKQFLWKQWGRCPVHIQRALVAIPSYFTFTLIVQSIVMKFLLPSDAIEKSPNYRGYGWYFNPIVASVTFTLTLIIREVWVGHISPYIDALITTTRMVVVSMIYSIFMLFVSPNKEFNGYQVSRAITDSERKQIGDAMKSKGGLAVWLVYWELVLKPCALPLWRQMKGDATKNFGNKSLVVKLYYSGSFFVCVFAEFMFAPWMVEWINRKDGREGEEEEEEEMKQSNASAFGIEMWVGGAILLVALMISSFVIVRKFRD